MKKGLSIIILLCVLGTIGARADFRWGAMVGYTGNTLVAKQNLVKISSSPGAQAGIVGEMMFPGIGFGVSFGLGYNLQDGKMNLGERKIWSSLGYGKENVVSHSIMIPVNLRFKWTRLNGLEDIVAPIVYGGPEFNIQVAHGSCDAFKYSGGDLGLTVGGGAELYKRWQVTGGYTWGMTYLGKTKLLDNYSFQARQWHVRVTYFF